MQNGKAKDRRKGDQEERTRLTVARAAGLDIARLLAAEAQQVYLCAREWKTQRDLERGVAGLKGCANIECRGMITQLTAAGGLVTACDNWQPCCSASHLLRVCS